MTIIMHVMNIKLNLEVQWY